MSAMPAICVLAVLVLGGCGPTEAQSPDVSQPDMTVQMPPTDFATDTINVAAADIAGDSAADIAGDTKQDTAVAAYQGPIHFCLSSATFGQPHKSLSAATGDLDGDGVEEIVFGNVTEFANQVWRQGEKRRQQVVKASKNRCL
jgi:hypothetical protein